MNLERNPFTEDLGPDFLQAISLEDLCGRLRVEKNIFGDDGEHLDAEVLISQIMAGKFDDLPKLNGLQNRARLLYGERFQHPFETSADLD